MTASAATCGIPASAARSWLSEAASSCGSRSPSRKSLARNSDWSRAGSRCNRVRSTIVSIIRSLRSRTRATVFWRPLSNARISAAAVTAMMTPKVKASAARMETRRGYPDDASSPLLDRAFAAPADLTPGNNFPARTLRNFGPAMDIRRSANCEQEKGRSVVRNTTLPLGRSLDGSKHAASIFSSVSSGGAARSAPALPSGRPRTGCHMHFVRS